MLRRFIGFSALAALWLSACAAGPQGVDQGAPAGEGFRIATFNVYLNRPEAGGLIADLTGGEDRQARKAAEIIQRTAPDIILLNEVDYDAAGRAIALFRRDYLSVSQNGAPAADYPFVFIAPVNTGLASGHDLDRDGAVTITPGSRAYGGDAFGYGEFPGQYGMALLSKYPIDAEMARTFQTFLWQDMPGALLPDDAANDTPADWYDSAALADFRLSSKSHWDVPVIVGENVIHILASHPTPPNFDGPEDRNGKRNHDEIRFWADYVSGAGDYIYDDNGGKGGLSPGACFVILGDQNADPKDGAPRARAAISRLLALPEISAVPVPQSVGGADAAQRQAGANAAQSGDPVEDTSDFIDDPEKGPGNLHLDYVLPSTACFQTTDSGVFWPAPDEPHYGLVGPGYPVESSDHRLVWRDLVID